MKRDELAGMIDHTVLKADATQDMIEKLCQEAMEHGFASVCVNPGWVPLCTYLLQGSGVKVCTVIGFPLGATSTSAKAQEAAIAVEQGAEELDMVINVGKLKDGEYEHVETDIRIVVEQSRGKPVKVILEICYLDDDEIITACELAEAAGASFVKTSTGFGPGGATVEAIKLMRQTVGDRLGVKASGGIRDYETAKAMVEAGANRIGASAGISIVEGAEE